MAEENYDLIENQIILNIWNHIMLWFSKVKSQFFLLYFKIVGISNSNDNLHLKKLNLCLGLCLWRF
jgi:hypothetical protein